MSTNRIHTNSGIPTGGDRGPATAVPGRRSRKREAIVEASIRLFTRYGYRRVTVEEICREAGASKMTFYKYFDNKQDLFERIWDGWIDEGYAWLDELDAMDIPFHEKMRQVIVYKMNFMAGWDPGFIEELLTDEAIAPMMDRFREKSYLRLRAFLEKAQARGDIRPCRLELVMAALERLQSVFADETLRGIYGDDRVFIRELLDFFMFGLVSGGPEEEES